MTRYAVHLDTDKTAEGYYRCGREVTTRSAGSARVADVTCQPCLKGNAADRLAEHSGAPVEDVAAALDKLPALSAHESERLARGAAAEVGLDEPRKVRPPMNRAEKRAERKRLKAHGIDPDIMYVRYNLDAGALAYAEDHARDTEGAHWTDYVLTHLQTAMIELENEGADIRKLTVITIGEHPSEPGGLRLEIKSKE